MEHENIVRCVLAYLAFAHVAVGIWLVVKSLRRKPKSNIEVVDIADVMAGTELHIHVRIRGLWRLRISLFILRTAAWFTYRIAGFRAVVEPIPEPSELTGDSDA